MIDHRPAPGRIFVRVGRRSRGGCALAINRRLAEADCWSDAMPFPGADASLVIGHRPVRGGFLSGWDAVPGADAGSQGGASETQGGLPWADLFCPVGAGVDEAVRRRDVAGRVAAGYSPPPRPGRIFVGMGRRSRGGCALAINRRLAEADCWSDAMPFPGADASLVIGHRPVRGGFLSGWHAVPGADADSQGYASETSGGSPLG